MYYRMLFTTQALIGHASNLWHRVQSTSEPGSRVIERADTGAPVWIVCLDLFFSFGVIFTEPDPKGLLFLHYCGEWLSLPV